MELLAVSPVATDLTLELVDSLSMAAADVGDSGCCCLSLFACSGSHLSHSCCSQLTRGTSYLC